MSSGSSNIGFCETPLISGDGVVGCGMFGTATVVVSAVGVPVFLNGKGGSFFLRLGFLQEKHLI